MKFTLALVVVASIDLLSSVCHAERILFLAPVATKSHKYAFMPILEALAERGHQVTLVSPFESKKQVKNIREIVVEDFYNDRDFDWFDRGSQGPWAGLVGIIENVASRMLHEKGFSGYVYLECKNKNDNYCPTNDCIIYSFNT